MKGAQRGLGEAGKAYAWSDVSTRASSADAWTRKAALVAGVAIGLAATIYSIRVAAADSQPTIQQTVTPPDAAAVERQWGAANRSYDEARKTILAQVQKTAWQGPMQPEWQSACKARRFRKQEQQRWHR